MYCIIHLQVLCGICMIQSYVTELAVSMVNFIFPSSAVIFSSDVEAEYPDLPSHTTVCWLSSGSFIVEFLRSELILRFFGTRRNALNQYYRILNGFVI